MTPLNFHTFICDKNHAHVCTYTLSLLSLSPSLAPSLSLSSHTRTLPKNDRVVSLVGALIDEDYTNGSNAVVLLIMPRYPRDLHAALKVCVLSMEIPSVYVHTHTHTHTHTHIPSLYLSPRSGWTLVLGCKLDWMWLKEYDFFTDRASCTEISNLRMCWYVSVHNTHSHTLSFSLTLPLSLTPSPSLSYPAGCIKQRYSHRPWILQT